MSPVVVSSIFFLTMAVAITSGRFVSCLWYWINRMLNIRPPDDCYKMETFQSTDNDTINIIASPCYDSTVVCRKEGIRWFTLFSWSFGVCLLLAVCYTCWLRVVRSHHRQITISRPSTNNGRKIMVDVYVNVKGMNVVGIRQGGLFKKLTMNNSGIYMI